MEPLEHQQFLMQVEPSIAFVAADRHLDSDLGLSVERLVNAYFRQLRARLPADDPAGPFGKLQSLWQFMKRDDRVLDVLATTNDPGSPSVPILRENKPIPSDIQSIAQAHEAARTRTDVPSMVPLTELSSGERALFSLAGTVLFRDRPADLILVDEPEQHLHAQWQALILSALRTVAPQAQIIVATHSEAIIRQALSHEVFTLVPDDDPRARTAASMEAGK